MTINISTDLQRWLLEKGLEGYIKVAEAPPHPDAFNIAQKLNVDTITNTMVRQKLGLSGLGEKQFDIAPAETLRKIFRGVLVNSQGLPNKGQSRMHSFGKWRSFSWKSGVYM